MKDIRLKDIMKDIRLPYLVESVMKDNRLSVNQPYLVEYIMEGY